MNLFLGQIRRFKNKLIMRWRKYYIRVMPLVCEIIYRVNCTLGHLLLSKFHFEAPSI